MRLDLSFSTPQQQIFLSADFNLLLFPSTDADFLADHFNEHCFVLFFCLFWQYLPWKKKVIVHTTGKR